ncbi:MAG: hypothetical protein M3Q29_21585 [Chloroflexota bacterium]|nr:hypothetical protein [Chloroflexota bacterium]
MEMYDYTASKADWLAWDLPRGGRSVNIPTVGEVARWDVPTCKMEEKVGDVPERARAPGSDLCAVVNSERERSWACLRASSWTRIPELRWSAL